MGDRRASIIHHASVAGFWNQIFLLLLIWQHWTAFCFSFLSLITMIPPSLHLPGCFFRLTSAVQCNKMQTASHNKTRYYIFTCFALVISLCDIWLGIAGLLFSHGWGVGGKQQREDKLLAACTILLHYCEEGLMGRSRALAAATLRYATDRNPSVWFVVRHQPRISAQSFLDSRAS